MRKCHRPSVRRHIHGHGISIFWIPPMISGTGKATNFNFCMHIHRIDRNKPPLKISGKVAVGVLRDSRKFSGHDSTHRAVIYAIAQLSFCGAFCG